MNSETRNILLFIVLSCLVVFGYDKYYQQHNVTSVASQVTTSVATVNEQQGAAISGDPVEEYIAPVDIVIRSDKINGSMTSKGSSISNITLLGFKESLDKNSDDVKLLKSEDGHEYRTEIWWVTDGNVKMPNNNTVWTVTGTMLTPNSPVIMTYDNKQGIVFEKKYTMDEDYVIKVEQTVYNNSNFALSVKPCVKIIKQLNSTASSWQTAYEGPIGSFNGKCEEVSYSNIDDKKSISFSSKGGWAGITEKYWLVSFIPQQDQQVHTTYHKIGNQYVVDVRHEAKTVQPGQSMSVSQNLFVGAKDINILDMYEKKLGVEKFDLAIDFGYLYFLTKPLLYLLAWTQDLIGNIGLGILLLTVILKLLLFPLANKSYRSMNRMKAVQPKIKAIQDRYADDRVKMGQELSELYKREKINPAGGCLPMLLQMPILFALYKVLYISIDMRHAPFYGWIHDLSAPDPMYIFNLCGLIPVDLPSFLQIGIWPLIMGLSMWIQQKMSPQVGDQAQAKMMTIMMPVMFTWMFAGLPSGLVIYWTWSNLLGMLQQYALQRIDTKA